MPKYKFDGKEWRVFQIVNYTCCGDDMKAISLQLRNQSTAKLFNQNLFISIRSCLLYFKRSRLDPLKMLDLLVLTVQSSTYELHERLLCEIIEQHKGIVVHFFYCRIIIQNDSFDCHVCMNECEIPIILISYIGHLFAFKF